MKHLAKRTLSLLLAALMVLSLIPANPTHVHAAEPRVAYAKVENKQEETQNITLTKSSTGVLINEDHNVWQINGGKNILFTFDDAFLADFNYKATLEIVFLAISGVSTPTTANVKYARNDGQLVSIPTPTVEDCGSNLKKATVTLTDADFVHTINGVVAGIQIGVASGSKPLAIKSVTVTEIIEEAPEYAPEFNEADFGGVYVYDDMASPALTVKNPHEDVEMTARIYVTLKKNGEALLTNQRFRKHEDGAISTTDPIDVISSELVTGSTSEDGTYELVVTSFIKVNGGDEVQIENTLSFKRATTFTHEVVEVDGNVYYSAKAVSEQAVSYAPNGAKAYVINAEGDTIVGPTSMGITLTTEQFNQNLHELIKDLDYGTYTIKVEAYKGSQLRGTATYEYNYEEPPAFAPEYGTISTVLDKASVPELTIKNTSETSEMTTAIKATLKLNGELHPDVKNVSVGPEEAVAAGQTATLISTELLSKYATAMGNWEIILTGTVTVDEVSYEVNETITFSRVATFTHEVVEVEGNLYYSAKAVSEEAVAYAPNGAKASVIDAEDNTIVGPTSMPITLTTEGIAVNLKELIKDLDYGTYTIKVEAYRNSELRGTTEYTYTIVAPPAFEPEFGTISTVLDNAAVPELTIKNTSETSEMTTAIKATLKLNGELHPNVKNVSVGPEEAVAAGQTATLISTELLSKFATAKGNWEIVLTGTVTVDGVAYDVNETISFSRIATFTHSLAVSDGNIIYTAKAESAEAEVFAPNGVKIYVEDAEGKTTIAGPTSQAVSVTVAGLQSSLNGVGIIKNLEPGTYTIKVEAYKNSELRNTATVQYTVAPKCEHSGVTNGDCTATTQVTCPDCQETVTVQAAHTYEDDNDCTTGHNCSVCGNEAVAAEDDHSYTDKQDASCNNKGCNYVRYIHYGSNVTLGNSIDVNVTVSIPAGEKDQHKAYIQVAGGEKVEVELTQNGTNFCDVTLPGLAAKDLYKEINVTVCDENGEEVHNVTESFAAYAERLFASEANDNDKKMIADMVAYAVAAQNYFLKNTDNSVIAQLEEAGVDYTQYTDDVNPTCTDERAFTGNRSLVQGTNFDLKDEISMNMYVRDVDYAVIEYIPYNKTELVSVTIQASECVKSGSYYKFKIPGYVTADGASTVVTAKFYVNGNDEPVVTVTDSMASYVARQGASLTWLYTMQKYANSAYAALTD